MITQEQRIKMKERAEKRQEKRIQNLRQMVDDSAFDNRIKDFDNLIEEMVDYTNSINKDGLNISPQFRRGQNHLLRYILAQANRFVACEEIDENDSSRVKFIYH